MYIRTECEVVVRHANASQGNVSRAWVSHLHGSRPTAFPPPAYPFFPSHVNPREATASRGILLRTWYPFQPGSLAVFPPMASEILGHRRHIARAQRAIVFATAFTLLGPRTYHHSVTPSGTAYPGPSVTWEGQATYEKRARCELQRRSHAGGVYVKLSCTPCLPPQPPPPRPASLRNLATTQHAFSLCVCVRKHVRTVYTTCLLLGLPTGGAWA